jgi:hypothetical protein
MDLDPRGRGRARQMGAPDVRGVLRRDDARPEPRPAGDRGRRHGRGLPLYRRHRPVVRLLGGHGRRSDAARHVVPGSVPPPRQGARQARRADARRRTTGHRAHGHGHRGQGGLDADACAVCAGPDLAILPGLEVRFLCTKQEPATACNAPDRAAITCGYAAASSTRSRTGHLLRTRRTERPSHAATPPLHPPRRFGHGGCARSAAPPDDRHHRCRATRCCATRALAVRRCRRLAPGGSSPR